MLFFALLRDHHGVPLLLFLLLLLAHLLSHPVLKPRQLLEAVASLLPESVQLFLALLHLLLILVFPQFLLQLFDLLIRRLRLLLVLRILAVELRVQHLYRARPPVPSSSPRSGAPGRGAPPRSS